MKALVKIYFLLYLFSFISCIQSADKEKNKSQVKRVNFFEKPERGNFADGIKISNVDILDYFFVDIDVPECCQKGTSLIKFSHEQFSVDSLIKSKQIVLQIDSVFLPVYQVNTLSIFNAEGETGAYFFYTMESPLGGFEPKELILCIYYKEVIYKLSGKIPVHADWSWEKTYTFFSDEKLKKNYPTVYKQAIEIWNENLQKYKKYYDNN